VGRALPLAALLALFAAAAWPEAEGARLASLLGAHPGATVADVGAGEGRWTIELAEAVGPAGRVFATEVEKSLLEKIEARLEAEGIGNVEVVRGDQRSTGLPAACCDAILLRLVYHHFVDPEAMRADLARALRPGGRLAIVETRPQSSWRRLEGVPERGGHGIEVEDLIGEMAQAGFRPVERHGGWNGDADRFAVVFEKAAAPPTR
jgi:protein-L-isoaspartate O-methyltransferase